MALEAAGHPVVYRTLNDAYDLGEEFFLWEIATAFAGYRLGINPFDQPDVESAKIAARGLLDARPEPVTKPGDRRVIWIGGPSGAGFSWWSEKEDLALSFLKPSNVDAMIDALDGRVPNATENPIRAGLAKAGGEARRGS